MEKKLIILLLLKMATLKVFSQIAINAEKFERILNEDSCSIDTDLFALSAIVSQDQYFRSHLCEAISGSFNFSGEILIWDNHSLFNPIQVLPFLLTNYSETHGKVNELREFNNQLYSFSKVCARKDTAIFLPLCLQIRKFDLSEGTFTNFELDSTYNNSDLAFGILNHRNSVEDAFTLYYVIDNELASVKFSDGDMTSRHRHGFSYGGFTYHNIKAYRLPDKDILMAQRKKDSLNAPFYFDFFEIIDNGTQLSFLSSTVSGMSHSLNDPFQSYTLGNFLVFHTPRLIKVFNQNLDEIFTYNFLFGEFKGRVRFVEQMSDEEHKLRIYTSSINTPSAPVGIDAYEIDLTTGIIVPLNQVRFSTVENLNYSLSNRAHLIRLASNRIILVDIPNISSPFGDFRFFVSLIDNDLTVHQQQEINQLLIENANYPELIDVFLIENAIMGMYKLGNGDIVYYKIELAESLNITDKKTELTKLSLYPNPATSKLHISSEDNMLRQYQITDLQGRKMQSASLPAQAAAHEIDIGQLAAGVYLLKVESEKGAMVKRFVKE